MAVDVSPGPGRVLIALTGGPLVAEPTWTRYDMLSNCRCEGWDSLTGRQTEFDVTDTGTATVYFHDRNNTLSKSLVGHQILLQLYNPVLAEWQPRWRGHIDDVDRELVDGPPDMPLANVALHCTGIFDYLGGCKMMPGIFGDVPPAGTNGVVFYEDERVDDRIIALLTDAGLAISMYVVFTGNVNVNETLYEPDDSVLQGLRDAADAEFPGVANVYEDRFGRVAFHGRMSRFDPETVAASASNWDFQSWTAATREDVTSGVAQIRAFAYNAPRARIINAYLAYPRADENGVTFDRSLIASLVKTDPTSITNYGYRGADAPDLIIKSNFNNANTGYAECDLFGQFYVSNYAQPREAIENVVFKAHRPDDARAAATWDLMCRMDISDRLTLTIDEAQLVAVPFFVDGVSVSLRALNQDYDYVEVTPNLTPASFYDTDVFS